MNLRSKFALSISGLIIGIFIFGGLLYVASERRNLIRQMQEEHAKLINRFAKVCENSLYQDDLSLVNYIQALKNERGFLAAAFINAEGKAHIHSDPSQIGNPLSSPTETQANSSNGIYTQSYAGEGSFCLDLACPANRGVY